MYLPASQAAPDGAELVVRSNLPPNELAPSILRKLRSINPAQSAVPLRPIQASVDHAVSPPAILRDACLYFRRPQPDARRTGHLRGYFLLGPAMNPGNRQPPGR